MDTSALIDQILVFIFTFTANLFASVSGGGAGFVQFPLLILMGLPFATALGTHKVAVVFLGIGALAKKKSNKFAIDKKIALVMILVGCPAVVAGTLIVINVPSHAAQLTVGIVTILMGAYTLVKRGFGSLAKENISKKRFAFGVFLMIIIGLFSGSLSSGAGLFSTMTLALVFGLELKRAIYHTMVFVATIWNAVGAVTVGAVTAIYWQWVPVMIFASFLGAFVGTALMLKMPTEKVRIIFSLVAILSGGLLIYTAMH